MESVYLKQWDWAWLRNHKIGENWNNVPKQLHDKEIKSIKKKQKRRSKNKYNMWRDITTDKEGGLSSQ